MAVYSSLCLLTAVEVYIAIFVHNVCSHLEWGLLVFRIFVGFPYVQQPPVNPDHSAN